MATKLISAAKLRWLVAETLVIVLGVLIALGLDDHWTDRQERLLAMDYVQRVQNDVNADLDYIRNTWNPRLREKREALEAIGPVVRGQARVPEDVVMFLRNISRGGMMSATAQPWVTSTTFEDLRSTGNLRLIRDPDVRAAISSYYDGMSNLFDRMQGRHSGYVSFVHTAIPAELRDNINLEAIERFGVDYALNRLLSDEFRNLANAEYNAMLFMLSQDFETYAERLHGVLEIYRLELEGQ
ncbi:MAG: hypothetical protein IIA10_09660 [Proteobacteria bacterium]|nr:hypothetical protein [Pseudomonadota bacterium]